MAQEGAQPIHPQDAASDRRPMSVWDGVIYNFLAMGVIFPWVYLWGPASFPGANIELAILITFMVQIPISVAYSFLAAALPVGGGDYVYQTRAFGRLGFSAVMSGFVFWILQWVALSGWLFATLGLAPLFLSLGAALDEPVLTKWGVAVQSPHGILLVSILLAITTVLILNRGLRLYAVLQRFLFAITIAAIIGVLVTFARDPNILAHNLNIFVAKVIAHLRIQAPYYMRMDFVHFLQRNVAESGAILSPAFSWFATLAIVPIAWTSLQWATYSVEQNDEIRTANRLRSQLIMLVGSAAAVTFFLTLIAHAEKSVISSEFMVACSNAYWSQKGSAVTISFLRTVLQPFPNVIAMSASGSILLAFVIGLGFLANAFQVTCNCFIGVSRILVQMSKDGLLDSQLRLHRLDSRSHAPTRAHWLYFIASVPIIAGYSLVPNWINYTLGVTFACGYVFMFSCFAAARLPTARMRGLVAARQDSCPDWIIRLFGFGGGSLAALMVVSYLVLPQLGLRGLFPYAVVVAVVLLSDFLFRRARARSPEVAQFASLPKEGQQ